MTEIDMDWKCKASQGLALMNKACGGCAGCIEIQKDNIGGNMKNLRPVQVTTTTWVENPLYDKNATYSDCKEVESPFIKGQKVDTRTKMIQKEEIYQARFHCWGVEYEECDQGPGNYTIALVEKNDGKIVTATPSGIRFMDM